MTEQIPVIPIQKLSTVWSSRRACQITLAIAYELYEENGCKIYKLKQIQELESR